MKSVKIRIFPCNQVSSFHSGEKPRKLLLGVLLLVTIVTGTCLSQDKISVVILKPELPKDQGQFCKNTIEIPYQVLRNLKLNGKSEARSEAVPSSGHPEVVTRQEYEHAKNIGLKDLAQLEVRDGVLYGLSKADETFLLFPQDKKPEKSSPIALLDMYKISVEGQDSQTKAKRVIDLKSVWKIFNLAPNDPVEMALFQHAAQENKPAFWKGYIKKTPEYKLTDALASLRDTLFGCVNDSLQAFADGSYSALADAEVAALEAQGVDDSGPTQELIAKVRAEQKNIQDRIALASTLVQSSKWDDGLTALDPLKKYLSQAKDLDAVYTSANTGSYNFHLQSAKDKLQANNFAQALSEYEIALKRRPDSSEAQSGRKEALVKKAIADSRQLRQRKKPDEAREQILAAISAENSVSNDTRIVEELKLANCEFGNQLIEDARKLVLTPAKTLKPIAGDAAEKAFVHADEKLKTAQSVCLSNPAQVLLKQVDTSLTSFHLEHAKSAKTRGLLALSLLHGQTALQYAPTNAEATSLKNEMDQAVQDKVQVKVGVRFHDVSPDHSCQQEASSFAQMLESQISSSSYKLLEPGQAGALYHTPQKPPNVALILGEVQTCSIRRSAQEQPIPSKYRVSNPAFIDAQTAEQNAEQQFKSCRSTYGEANCGAARQNLESARQQRRNTQEWVKYDYTYSAKTTTVYGKENVTLRVLSPLNQQSASPFQEEIGDQCVEEIGVRDDDDLRSGVSGIISNTAIEILKARRFGQNHCPLFEDEQYKSTLQQNIQQRLKLAIPYPLVKIAEHYLRHARQASDRESALDSYLMALMAGSSTQSEFQEALGAIRSQAPDLHPEVLISPQTAHSEISNVTAMNTGGSTDVAMKGPAPEAQNTSLSRNSIASVSEGERPVLVSKYPTTPKLKDEMPSAEFAAFQGNAFEISYPSNWRVNRTAQGVIIGPSFALQHRAVVCGAIVGSYPASGKPFEQAANEFGGWVKRQTPEVIDLTDNGPVNINGVTGRSFYLTATSLLKDGNGEKQNERDWIIAIPHKDGNSLDWIAFVAPERDFHLFSSAFDRMLQSFKVH